MIYQLQEDIIKHYDKKPIIVIHDEDQLEEISNIMQSQKLKFRVGVHGETLTEVRQWDYGILLIRVSEGRGVDTRF
jgi:hypothetical protein